MMRETTHALGTQHKTKERSVYRGVVSPEIAATISMEEFKEHQNSLCMTTQKLSSTRYQCPAMQTQPRSSALRGQPTDGYWKGKNPTRAKVLNFTLVVPSTDCDVFSVLLEPKLASSNYHLGAQVFLKPHTPLVNSPTDSWRVIKICHHLS
jgi:hypothetical protein